MKNSTRKQGAKASRPRARKETLATKDARTPREVTNKLVLYSVAERSDQKFPHVGTPEFEQLRKRYIRLAQIVVPPYGYEHPYDSDDIAAAFCELIDYFTYAEDMTDREMMACAVVSGAFVHVEAKDPAEESFRRRRLILDKLSISFRI